VAIIGAKNPVVSLPQTSYIKSSNDPEGGIVPPYLETNHQQAIHPADKE
jgi:hypothetical protein